MIHRLKHQGAGAVNALDWLCHVETMWEILDAMTPQQLVVAALLVEGMTLKQISAELDITFQAVQARRKAAQERVARSVPPELMGDVMARRRWIAGPRQLNYGRNASTCLDCGRLIHARSTRCNSCAQKARYSREAA